MLTLLPRRLLLVLAILPALVLLSTVVVPAAHAQAESTLAWKQPGWTYGEYVAKYGRICGRPLGRFERSTTESMLEFRLDVQGETADSVTVRPRVRAAPGGFEETRKVWIYIRRGGDRTERVRAWEIEGPESLNSGRVVEMPAYNVAKEYEAIYSTDETVEARWNPDRADWDYTIDGQDVEEVQIRAVATGTQSQRWHEPFLPSCD